VAGVARRDKAEQEQQAKTDKRGQPETTQKKGRRRTRLRHAAKRRKKQCSRPPNQKSTVRNQGEKEIHIHNGENRGRERGSRRAGINYLLFVCYRRDLSKLGGEKTDAW